MFKLINPIIAPFYSSPLINIVIFYEIVVFLIEFLCLTFTLRWRLHKPLYGRSALVVFSANLASFFLVPLLLLILTGTSWVINFLLLPLLTFFLLSFLLTFVVEYIVIAGIFHGLEMVQKERKLGLMLILVPVVFLSNFLTLLLGIIPSPIRLYWVHLSCILRF